MTTADIIRMAREAGMTVIDDRYSMFPFLERFAALVAAAEREDCAKVCEDEAGGFQLLTNGAHDGRYDWKSDAAMDCANAIRARGK